MGVVTSSGSVGCVSAGSVVSNTSTWSVNVKESSHAAVTSATKKGTMVVSGTKDWDGSFSFYGTALPTAPGSKLTFTGYTGKEAVVDTAGSISGPIVIASAATTINVGTGEPVKWDVTFSGNGKPTIGSTAVSDSGTPQVISAAGATVRIGGSATTMQVSSIAINLASAVSGGTATSASEGWLIRCAGPLSGTVAITVMDSSINPGLNIGDDIELEIELSSGATIVMKYVHITDFSGVTVDNSSAEPIQYTINGQWTCHNGTAYGELSAGGTAIWE